LQLILSHTNADFDALGSMVGASKLYPHARLVLTGGQDRNVHEFLTLHEEFLDLLPAKSVDRAAVSRIIVVETQESRRLGELAGLVFQPHVEVILYDHHVGATSDIPAGERHVEAVGAATTLLVRELRSREADEGLPAPLTPLEATAMLLGIYEDTGSLSFSATTAEDLEAAAWLLRAGGSLDVVARFVNRALTEEQRRLLNKLLATTEYEEINGVSVALAVSEAGPFVDELALLAHKLSELENVPLVFVLARMGETVYVVGRSRSDVVDVGTVLAEIGGGGHRRAASAVLHHTEVAAARAQLLDILRKHVRREPVAREIMSVPPRTIAPDASVAEARRRMVRYGHSGLSVVEDGQLRGVITRRDADKARHHHLSHAPVKGFMTRRVVTASPDMPLSDMERRMIEHDVGRLPVLEGGRVVGVVTRSDLLRARCGSGFAGTGVPTEPDDIRRRLEERLPVHLQEVLRQVGDIAERFVDSADGADQPGVDLYLVGGFVRDLLLDVQNLDVDLVIVGDATRFAVEVAQRMQARLKGHQRFSTATVTFQDGLKLDFSTARSESYGQPGALPEVEASSIEDDLERRDFSINAMAIRLNAAQFGRLLDPFGGRGDLERGIVRVLHNLSFVEDPTRLFRAIRFEARYGFHMDAGTEALARDAVTEQLLNRVSPERLRAEFNRLFHEPNPFGGLKRLAELGVLAWLAPALSLRADRLERVEGALAWTTRHSGQRPDRMVVYLATLLADLGPASAAAVTGERLRLSVPKQELLALSLQRLPAVLETLLASSIAPRAIYRAVHSLPIEVVTLLRVWSRERLVQERLEAYLSRLRGLRLAITGDDLRAAGVPPGPGLGEALRATMDALLDGEVAGRSEELAYALRLTGKL
jgi:tRNA nucleotidyltransferase (CCA-adding enzyme)